MKTVSEAAFYKMIDSHNVYIRRNRDNTVVNIMERSTGRLLGVIHQTPFTEATYFICEGGDL